MSDAINPSHYKHLPVEAIDIIMAAIAKAPSNEAAYLQGQVLKYLLRCWEKKGIEDLRKAKWYLDRLVNSFDDDPFDAIAQAYNSHEEKPIVRLEIPSGWRELEPREKPLSSDMHEIGGCWQKRSDDSDCEYEWYDVRHIRKIEEPKPSKDQPPNNNQTAHPSGKEPPAGYRWLKCGTNLIEGDSSVNRRGEIQPIDGHVVGKFVAVERLFVRKIEVQE